MDERLTEIGLDKTNLPNALQFYIFMFLLEGVLIYNSNNRRAAVYPANVSTKAAFELILT